MEDTQKIGWEIINRANKIAGNPNFQIKGFDQTRFLYAIQATLEVLNEKGLLSGCLLCRNQHNEKEES